MHRPLRVLFIASGLRQGGSERYLYEVCQALDRSKFHVEILVVSTSDCTNEFYYPRISAMGFTIHQRIAMAPKSIRSINYKSVSWKKLKTIVKMILKTRKLPSPTEFQTFIEQYDIVSVIQIETYLMLREVLDSHAKVIVHLMSHKFQYDYDPYASLVRDKKYRFIVFGNEIKDEVVASLGPKSEFQYVPLILNTKSYDRIYKPRSGGRSIAVFSRISSERRLDGLLYCLQGLAQNTDAKFIYYGGGDATVLASTLRILKLTDRIEFRGHQLDLRETILRDQPTMTLGLTYDASVGYGPLETAAHGVPGANLNFGRRRHEDIADQTRGAIHTFLSVPDLTQFALGILNDDKKLEALGETMRNYVIEHHGVAGNIGILEQYYEHVASSN